MGEAADRYAAVTRSQFENYKQFGYPLEDTILGMMNNNQTLDANLTAGQGIASTAGNVAGSEVTRGLQAYGANPTAGQTVTNNRLNNLSTTANTASARDFIRGATLERDRTILTGGAPNANLQNITGG